MFQASLPATVSPRNIALPVVFEPNRGQAGPGVQFLGRAQGLNVALTGHGISVNVTGTAGSPASLRIQLRGSGPLVWSGAQPAAGETNYFLGSRPSEWRTHIPHFARVVASSARGVGLAVYGGPQGMEYDLRADAGVDPARIRMDFTGARPPQLDSAGNLLLRVGGQQVRLAAPVFYELASASYAQYAPRRKAASAPRAPSLHRPPRGSRTRTPRKSARNSVSVRKRKVSPAAARRRKKAAPFLLGIPSPPAHSAPKTPSVEPPQEQGRRIEGGYVLEADGSVGLWVGAHDPQAALLIDPVLSVVYDTFLGGSGSESANGMALDAAGNIYLGGTTTSATGFLESATAFAGPRNGAAQLFLAKVAPADGGAGTLEYLSFFGGSATQAGGKVAVDSSGNAAILGVTTSADYPVTDGSVATRGLTRGAGNDLVVSEVDPSGANLIFSTLFGGNGRESQYATDGFPLNNSQKVSAAMGGIAFDVSGDIYVASDTTSTDLPATASSFQPGFGGAGAFDGFLAVFQPSAVVPGGPLLYCSYLGTQASGGVAVGGVAVSPAYPPLVYIAGLTSNNSIPFPARNAFQTSYGGGSSDAFLMQVSPQGAGTADLVYSTLLGGAGADEALGVALDSASPPMAYVVGASDSQNLPEAPLVAGPSLQRHAASGPGLPAPENAFLAVVAWSGARQSATLQYFTYLGGSQADAAESVAAVFSNAVYLGGTASSPDFGWRDNAQPLNGASSAFIAKLDTTQPGPGSLLYATPLAGTTPLAGASVFAAGNAIAADPSGHAFLAGATNAPDFPVALTSSASIGGFQPVCESCPGFTDAFLTALDEAVGDPPGVSFGLAQISFAGQGPVPIGNTVGPALLLLSNTGTGTLHISAQPSVTGPNGGDFSVISSGCLLPILPGNNCQIEVSFTPSTAGLESGALTIVDDAPGSPQFLDVAGQGSGPLSVLPASLAFSPSPVNPSAPQQILLTLTAGAQSISGLGFPIIGTDASNFVINRAASTCTDSLQSAQSCVEAYQFRPTAVGNFSAVAMVVYNAGGVSGPQQRLPLTGMGTSALPVASFQPSSLSFGSQSAGTQSPAQTLQLSNSGSATLHFMQPISLAGANATEFLESTTCGPVLAVGAACTITVRFFPQTAGTKTANLLFADDAANSPQSVPLSGSAAALASQIQVSPSSWGFAPQSIGSRSAPQTITIFSTGGASLSFGQPAFALAGANASDFSQANNCPPTLGPAVSGQTPQCTVSVTFTPTGAGNRTAVLTIADNAPASPQTVPLSGSGVQANATILPASLSFAPQLAGTSSTPQTVTVTSTGPGQPLRVSGISLPSCGSTAAASQDFCETDDCSGVAIATACTVNVTFAPLCKNQAAARSATLTIQDNAATPSQSIPLSGSATGDFCALPLAGLTQTVSAGTPAIFPAVSLLSVSAFTGNVSLSCTSVPTGPSCSFSPFSAVSVSPNVPGQFELVAATSTSAFVPPHPFRPHRFDFPERNVPLAAAILVVFVCLSRAQARTLRPRRRAAFAVLYFVALAAGLAACGGGSGYTATAPPAPVDPPIPAGTYTITVTASDGNESLPLTYHLIVTP